MIKNSIYIFSNQCINFLVPLIIFPYLVKTIGIGNFGKISYIYAIMVYFSMIVDYGLNTTSVRKVSIHRNTIEMLSKTFTTTLSLKIVMSGFCFIILLFSCFFLELKKDIIYFYINSFLFVVGSAIIPTWFFQGLERMNFVFILNFFAKFFFFIFIFIGIRTENDYNFVLLFWGLGTTLSGILGLVIIKINYQLIWHLFNVRNMIEELKEGFPIFVSNISTLGLTQSNIIILNRFTDDVTVGYFSIAEKVIGAVWQILSAYSQVLYPRLSQIIYKSDSSEVGFFLRKTFWVFFLGVSGCSIILYFYAYEILQLLFHNYNQVAVNTLQLMSIIPILVCSNIPANITLLALDKRKMFSNIFVFCSIFHVGISLVLTYYFGLKGAILSSAISLSFLSFKLHYFVLTINNSYYFFKFKKN